LWHFWLAPSVYCLLAGQVRNCQTNGGFATIPAAKLADGKAHFYKYEDGGKEITFFAVRASDGTVRTAFVPAIPALNLKKAMNSRATR